MKSTQRSFSITGAAFAGVYATASAICIAAALATDDFKGQFVLLQLPIALQMSVLPATLLRTMDDMSWPLAYLLFGLPTLGVLYLLGAALGSAANGDGR